jgi:MYXO-CTERM domain-containing protein
MSAYRVVLVVCLLAPVSAEAQWGPETPMTATGSDVWGEGIAASGSTLHVIYGTGAVFYRSSPDEGGTWSTERQLDSGTIHLTDPIWADGNDVWIVYLKDIRNETDWCCSRDLGNIYLLHSGNGGSAWDPPKQLTTSQGAYRISLTYAAGRLHLVWMDFRSGAWDTYYLRSPDRGASWDPEKRIAISAGTFGAERPQVAARGDSVHVTIWDDRGPNPACMAGPTFSFASCPDTFYMESIDGGRTWGPEVNVANSGAAIAGRNDIAVAGNSSVVIVFNRSAQNTADANPHVYTIHSPDNGMTWDAPVQLTNTPGQADHGSIIGSGADVHLAWHDSRNGNLVIYYAGSKTEGVSWAPEERVSNGTTADSSTPLVAVSPNFAHVVWLDHESGSWQVHYRRRALGTTPPPPDAGVAPDATLPADAGATSSDAGAAGDAAAPACPVLCHTEVCSNGTRTCAPGRTPCNSAGSACLGCKDLENDPMNCGMCGTACGAGEVCAGSQCVAACPSGVLMCGASCVSDPANDVAHCGGCTTVCSPGEYCASGLCASTPGSSDAGSSDSGGPADAMSPESDAGPGPASGDDAAAQTLDAGAAVSSAPSSKSCGCQTSSDQTRTGSGVAWIVLLCIAAFRRTRRRRSCSVPE